MSRSSLLAVGLSAWMVVGLVGIGCSSSNGGGGGGSGGGGSGGSAGAGGQGGAHDGGAAGAGGGGQAGSDGGGQDGGLAMCSAPAPTDQSVCNSNPSCVTVCGLDVHSLTLDDKPHRTCTCSGSTAQNGKWSCPSGAGSCVYPQGIDLGCTAIPTTLAQCSTTGDGGTGGLIQSGVTTCTPPPSETCGNVCGSAMSTVNSYRDSGGTARSGYCVCIVDTWQCASVNDWPML